MNEIERRYAHVDHAYTQVVAEHTIENGTEGDAQLDNGIQQRLREIYQRARGHAADANRYHRFGMYDEVLLAGETVRRIEALKDLGYIALGEKSKVSTR